MDKCKYIAALALVVLAGGAYASEPVEPEQKLVEEGEEYEEVVIDPESVVEPIPMIPVIEIEEGRKVKSMEGENEGALDVKKVESVTKVIVCPAEPCGSNTSAANSVEKVYDAVEEQAQFPAGPGAMTRWIRDNMIYPALAQEHGVEGKVIVQFVVEKDGTISNPVVVRGVDKELDREAIRLVKAMPKWTPGRNNGTPVRSRFILPITFKVQH